MLYLAPYNKFLSSYILFWLYIAINNSNKNVDDESESINYDDHGNSIRLFIKIDSPKSYGNYLSGFMNLYMSINKIHRIKYNVKLSEKNSHSENITEPNRTEQNKIKSTTKKNKKETQSGTLY